MHPQNGFMVWSLFVLVFITLVQCATLKTQSKKEHEDVNINEFLFNLSSKQKCPYLQGQLLKKNEFNSCYVQNYSDVINASISSDNHKKLICLLFVNTYTQICKEDLGVTTKLITLDTIKKAEEEQVDNVCKQLAEFYKPYNTSKLGKFIQTPINCQRLCADYDESVFPVCSASALMANVNNQIVQRTNLNSQLKSVVMEMPSPPESETKTAVKMNDTSKPANIDSQISPKVQDNIPTHTEVKSQSESSLHIEGQDRQSSLENPKQSEPGLSGKAQTNQGTLSGPDETPKVENKQDKNLQVETKVSQSAESQNLDPDNGNLHPPNDKTSESTNNNVHKTSNDNQLEPVVMVSTTSKPALEKELNYDNNDELEADGELPDEKNIPDVNKLPAEKPLSTKHGDEFSHGITSDEIPGDSYFFSYFMFFCVLFVIGYVGYHNKQKILALVLEGRRGRRQHRRRPNTANYHKLDSNLEEAVTSSCDKTTSNVIY